MMGNLNPGATLIYERANGVVYARESGKTERVIVGYDGTHDPAEEFAKSEWNEIFQAAKTDPALQEAVDRVKVLYKLSKQQ
jgi:hypothetical protein